MDLASNIKTIREKQSLMQKEVVLHICVDKSTLEQMELIRQLDEEDKSTVFKIINKIFAKKFKDFFNKNLAAL